MMLLPAGRSNASNVHAAQLIAPDQRPQPAGEPAALTLSPYLITTGKNARTAGQTNRSENGYTFSTAAAPKPYQDAQRQQQATAKDVSIAILYGHWGEQNGRADSSDGQQSRTTAEATTGIAAATAGMGSHSNHQAVDRVSAAYHTLLGASSAAATAGATTGPNPIQFAATAAVVSSVFANTGNWQELDQHMAAIQSRLKPGWTVHLGKDGRLYYCNHSTGASSWLPSCEDWSKDEDLPYAWERAIDQKGRTYYINHMNKTSTYEAPESLRWEEARPPKQRVCVLQRSPTLGFGFVAGSEKPVIVRFVTEGGPSINKLQPGDQILAVNGEDVKEAPRDHVIQLVRACESQVTLLVCQPAHSFVPGRKSTLLSAGKRAKLRTRPSRVRFAESVCVNGSPLFPPSAFSLGDICVPPMANVLKVFLENGQTKSFKYDVTTSVQDVVTSLQDKLCLSTPEIFSLVLEHVKSLKRNKLTLLDPEESLARIAARPGAHKLRCLFRVTFVPVSAAELAQRDLNGLDYLYLQCCNDVTQERFAPELQPEVALRLAALHMHQHALANNISPSKLTVKVIEREFGLERFVSTSLFEGMKRKELRRLIAHFLKLNAEMTGSSSKILTQLQAKLYYLDIIGSLPSYGAKCFSTNQREGVERVLLVSPRFGLSQISSVRNSIPQPISSIEDFTRVIVTRDDDVNCSVNIFMRGDRSVKFSMEDREACEFSLVLAGYHRLLTGQPLPLDREREEYDEDNAPPYLAQHTVLPSSWSYLPPFNNHAHCVNFLLPPPYHPIERSRERDTESLREFQCDKNMNSPNVMDSNATFNATAKKSFPSSVDLDMHSVMATALLEEAKDSGQQRDRNEDGACSGAYGERYSHNIAAHDVHNQAFLEAKNEEVLRRVQEMQKMVQNSEQYLNEQGENMIVYESSQMDTKKSTFGGNNIEFDSDCDSLNSSKVSSSEETPQPGALKHSDSLVLLAEAINQDLSGITKSLNSIEDNCSDATGRGLRATSSPRPERKHNNGLGQLLSNLEALGTDFSQSESDSESINSTPNSPTMRRPTTFNVGSGLNQKENVGYRGSFGLHSPDGVNFGPEAKGYNLRDYLKQLKDISSVDFNSEDSGLAAQKLSKIYGFEIRDDTFVETDSDLIDLRAIPPPQTPDELDALSVLNAAPHGFADVATKKIPYSSGGTDAELDRFLAKVVVAPPTQRTTPAKELTPEEIMSFIIPPPPNLNEVGGERIAAQSSTSDDAFTYATTRQHSNPPQYDEEPTENLYSNALSERRNLMNRNPPSMASGHSEEAALRTHVIEYATVERKSKFSCCPKSRKEDTSPASNQPDLETCTAQAARQDLKPPPRAHTLDKSPPARPPKSAELIQRLSPKKQHIQSSNTAPIVVPAAAKFTTFGRGRDEKPPTLPPRPSPNSYDANRSAERCASPTVSFTPPKKPPLPPIGNRPTIRSNGTTTTTTTATTTTLLASNNIQPPAQKPPPPLLPRPGHHHPPSATQNILHSNGHVRSAAATSDSHTAHIQPHQSQHAVPMRTPQQSIVSSPQAARKMHAPFKPPTSPLPTNKYIIKNGHIIDGEALLAKTDIAMAGLLVKLDQVAAQCTTAQAAGGGSNIDEEKFQRARSELTEQTLVLVTSSKYLVVAMSDMTLSTLPEHLTSCLAAIRRITDLTQSMTLHTSAPLQTRNIVLKVHDVTSSFRELVGVQIGPLGAGQLALQAECLANVLATLLRSLRVFSP